MKKFLRLKTIRLFIGISSVVPALSFKALAQDVFGSFPPIDPADGGAQGGAGVLMAVIGRVINFAVGLLVLLAVAIIIYAAYLYLFAGGQEEKMKSARKTLTYVVIAIAVALLARVLVFIVGQLLGTNLDI